MNKEDFGAVKNLYESIINEAPLRPEGPLWDGPNDKPGSRTPTTSRSAPAKPDPFARSREIANRMGLQATVRNLAGSSAGIARGSGPTSATPARPGTSSPAAPTTAQKIASGLKTYDAQKKAGDVKGAEATGKSTWALANPKLAAAQAERDRTRGTSSSTNPLMKDFKDRLPAPTAPSPTTTATAFSKNTPALGSSSSAVQSGGSAAASRPSTNQTATAFSSPSLVRSAPSTPAAKPSPVIQRRPTGPGTGAMTRGGASGDVGPNARSIRSSYEWGTKTTLKDMTNLYNSVYESKKKDQDKDGDNDFADVRIARMIASGVPKNIAIAKVKNKSYNEEYELYEILASYLLENNLAETINDANIIIENMSEKWILEILENI